MKAGDRVRLRKGITGVVTKPGRPATAIVARLLDDVKGGVCLDRPLAGLRYWNVADLLRVKDKT